MSKSLKTMERMLAGPLLELSINQCATLASLLIEEFLNRDRRNKDVSDLYKVAERAVPVLIGMLAEEDFELRWNAAVALRLTGPPAVPALILSLGHEDHDTQDLANYALQHIGPAAVPALILALNDTNRCVRRNAAEILGGFEFDVDEAVPAITDLLNDPELSVRASAAGALSNMVRPLPDGVVDALIQALDLTEVAGRREAAAALCNTGLEGAPAIPALARALKDQNEWVRGAAAETLGSFGSLATEAVPALIDALWDSEYFVQYESANALGEIGPTSVTGLIRVLLDASGSTRRHAAFALGCIGIDAMEAVPYLNAVVEDADRDVRISVDLALHKITGSERKYSS